MDTFDGPTLDRALAGLVGDGTLDHDQATAVRAAVTSAARRHAPATGQPGPGAGARTEGRGEGRGAMVAAYLGMALIVVAVGLLLFEQWEEMTRSGRVTLFGGLTLVFAVGGFACRGEEDTVLDRLRGMLWLLAVATGAVVGHELQGDTDSGDLFGGALGALVVAVPAYGMRRAPAQLIGLIAGVGVAAGATLDVADAGSTAAGVIVALLGAMIIGLAVARALPPLDVAYALGALLWTIGAEVAWFETKPVGAVLAGVLLMVSYVVAMSRTDVPALVVATVTAAIFGPQVLSHLFGDTIGVPVVLLASGLLVLGAVGVHVTLARARDAAL